MFLTAASSRVFKIDFLSVFDVPFVNIGHIIIFKKSQWPRLME